MRWRCEAPTVQQNQLRFELYSRPHEVAISEVDRGLFDARINRGGINVDCIELGKDPALIHDPHARHRYALVAPHWKQSLVSEQEKGTGLRLDPIVCPLCLHAEHRAKIIGLMHPSITLFSD
ncbi:hypothetical protein [Bosea massiliensis]|uniref:LysR substrate-binding domain-containing protein n=1 Tax=Bosea massiliensis TaxID=151419 RepID=A0ABW0P6S3_9HYPH